MEEKKIGLKGYQIVLCILGILILVGLIAAPPLLRTFLPAEEGPSASPGATTNPSPSSQPVEDFIVLSCKKEEYDENGYSKTTTKQIFHQGTKIKRLETITEEKFVLVNELNQEKHDQIQDACQNIPESYKSISGYTRTCTHTTSGGETFTRKETYDLTTFVEATIIDNAGNSILVSSDALLDADYTILQKELEGDAYICQ